MSGPALLLLKMAIVAGIVVLAAFVAERTRPVFGALIATLPFSLGPAYVLVAMDHDTAFLAGAALKTIASAGATVAFIAGFALTVVRLPLAATVAMAFAVWGLAAWPTYTVDWSPGGALLFSAALLALARAGTHSLRAYRPSGPITRRWWDIPLRAGAVALLVGLIAGLSGVLGPAGVGTLASFPIDLEGVLGAGLPVWCDGAAAPPSVAGLTFVAWQQPIACGGVAVFPDDIIVADKDGAVLIPAALLDWVLDHGPEQERMEAWIMDEVARGVPLPGLYPMNAETKARYESSKK